mgnify:CR=1 FL=1
MSKPFIIGLCGFARSGKSTVAQHLVDNHKFEKVNFKDGLVSEMRERLNNTLLAIAKEYSQHDPTEWDIERLFFDKPPIMRALMQEYGTEVRRADNKNHWVKTWIRSIMDKNLIVVDDVRFQNEYDAVKDMGGIIIRVKRSDITTGGDHQSETEHLSFKEDFIIDAAPNDHAGAYAQLETIIDTIKINND